MDRRTTVVAVAVVALLSVAAWAKSKSQSSSSSKPSLELVSIDRAQRQIHVTLHGYKKPPPGNFFAMTDDRGRHYVAQSVHCQKPDDATQPMPCALEIPDGYERHPLLTLELHTRGLHSRTIAVPADVVAAAWNAPALPDGGAPPDLAPSKP